MAIKIATWLANVNEAGSIKILTGEKMGINIPTAHKTADTVSV